MRCAACCRRCAAPRPARNAAGSIGFLCVLVDLPLTRSLDRARARRPRLHAHARTRAHSYALGQAGYLFREAQTGLKLIKKRWCVLSGEQVALFFTQKQGVSERSRAAVGDAFFSNRRLCRCVVRCVPLLGRCFRSRAAANSTNERSALST